MNRSNSRSPILRITIVSPPPGEDRTDGAVRPPASATVGDRLAVKPPSDDFTTPYWDSRPRTNPSITFTPFPVRIRASRVGGPFHDVRLEVRSVSLFLTLPNIPVIPLRNPWMRSRPAPYRSEPRLPIAALIRPGSSRAVRTIVSQWS